jgi:aerobic-type carbon monoxide dehydrogenase small subunit (CoxS/CutS family)
MKPRAGTFSVNGKPVDLASVPDDERLLDTLRWRLALRGTKEGCRSGACGACTILLDGRAVLSCLLLTHEADQGSVQTIESIGDDPVGRSVVHAFAAEEAVQCGYCTPGFVLALTGLLKGPFRSAEPPEVLEELNGNLCRCTGYVSIERAVRRARKEAP